ncbi:MAG: cation transporter [Phormidesmis sp. RL_2_1]|nr:cation transporter [Phormidesmis sp. RL_2_1]
MARLAVYSSHPARLRSLFAEFMHAHHHHLDHVHHGHGDSCSASKPAPKQLRALKIALVLVTCFSGAELWVSAHSNSLSLLADAGHMATDVFAIALALWAASQVDRDDSERRNALAALVNGGVLLLLSSWLSWEAITALLSPPTDILSLPVAITAAVGLGVNGLNAYLLHAHADENLNLRAAFLHMLADAGSCLGVLIGALLIAQFGWYWADGVVSGAIALLIATTALPLVRQSWASLNQLSTMPE